MAAKEGGPMASSREFAEYAADQLSGAGEIGLRKMFGEYGLYLNGKYFAAVCDDRLLVKVTAPGQALFAQPVLETPYPGGSAMLLVEELEDRDFLARLALTTCAALPEPKRKKKN